MKEYYLEILNNHPDAAACCSENGKLLFYNKSFSSLYLFSDTTEERIFLKDILLKNVDKGNIIHKEDHSYGFVSDYLSQFNAPMENFFVEFNSGKIYEVIIKVSKDKNRLIYHKEVTELKRSFEITKVKLQKLELIMETIFSGVISFNDYGDVDYINKSAEKIFYGSLNNKKLSEIKLESFFDNVSLSDITNKNDYGIVREFIGKRITGETFPIEIIVNKINSNWSLAERRKENRQNFIATINDLTESKKLAFELQQSQKMDAIGSLASGIAHDFNNILSVIIGSSSLLKNTDQEQGENINNIINASQRAKNLIQQILNYSKQDNKIKDYINFSKVVDEAIQFIKQTISSSIIIKTSMLEKDVYVYGDETEIHRCILNLLTNSAAAIGNSNGIIKVDLKTDNKSKKIVLSISDNGIGIKPEIQNRIFDPFFSTKDKSEGTGLGLSMVRRILKDHGADISFKSEYKKGTSFEIVFQLTEKKGNKLIKKNKIIDSKYTKPKGSIIFVDDEELIVKVSVKILTNAGYDVLGLSDGREALNLIKKNPTRFSLVISDQNMPHINGLELATKIRKINPNLKIIICSGYTDGIDKSDFGNIRISKLVSKPITAEELVKIVNKLLVKGL